MPEALISNRVILIVVFVSALLAFAGTLGHDFVWDDQHILDYTHQVVARSGPAGLWKVPFLARPDDPSDTSGYYRPLSFISMWINDTSEEPSPFWYHLLNVILHAANSVLLLILINQIIPDGPAAFLGGLLFAVHPVHAESVAFISGRTDLLATFFTLITAILWWRSRSLAGRWPITALAPGLLCFSAACLSKEIAFVFPAVIALWALADPKPSADEGRLFMSRDMIWFLGTTSVVGLIVVFRIMVLKIPFGPGWSSGALTAGSGLYAMVMDSIVNTGFYLRLLFFPWDLKVYYSPSPPVVSVSVVLAAIIFLVLGIMSWGKIHGRVGYISLFWTLVFIFPVSGVVGLGSSVIAERFCYLPSAGAAMLAGYSLARLWAGTSHKRSAAALFAVLLIILFSSSVRHGNRWADEITLFTHAVSSGTTPVPNMYFNLGNAYVEAGRPREGIEAFRQAIRLRPSYADAMLNMASTYIMLDEHHSALEVLTRAKSGTPEDTRLWANLAVVYELLGRYEDALNAYHRSAELDPSLFTPRLQRGKLLLRMGRVAEAVEDYRAVLDIDAGNLPAMIGLGRALEAAGMVDEAEMAYFEAMEKHPGEIITYLELGRMLMEQRKPREAGAVFRMALKFDPSNTVANKGVIISSVGMDDAVAARRHLESIRDPYPELFRELSEFYDEMDEKDDIP